MGTGEFNAGVLPEIIAGLMGHLTRMQTSKDDFQSVLRSLSTLIFINIISSHSMECESMLFVTNHIPYL